MRMKVGNKVVVVALDFPSREKWEGRVFTITEFFVPNSGNGEKWARLDGGGGVWPLRMLRAA